MADQIEINIYLKNDGTTPDSQDAVVGSGGDIPGLSQASSDATKQNQALSAMGKYVASQTISVFLDNVKGSISSNIGLITGKTELQERVNFGMQIVQEGVNTFNNAAAGAAVFSALGMSTGVGAVIGVALSAINYGINIAFNVRQLNIQENLENRQISQTLSRNGAGYNKSRSGV